MQTQLLVIHSSQLLEKEHSGCRALLRDDKVFYLFNQKIVIRLVSILRQSDGVAHQCCVLGSQVEDLSRMYRLFFKIPKGLDPVANIFKQVLHFSA